MTRQIIQKKVCLLGDFAVGKTSLIRRFVEGRYDDKYLSTIGVKISRKPIEREDYILNMLIWDLAGGDDFYNIGQNYLRGAAAALIVCDLTRADTVNSFETYANQLKNLNGETKMVFVGNKADLELERVIEDAELKALVDAFGSHYFATSAKTGFQVEAAFRQLAEQIEIR